MGDGLSSPRLACGMRRPVSAGQRGDRGSGVGAFNKLNALYILWISTFSSKNRFALFGNAR